MMDHFRWQYAKFSGLRHLYVRDETANGGQRMVAVLY